MDLEGLRARAAAADAGVAAPAASGVEPAAPAAAPAQPAAPPVNDAEWVAAALLYGRAARKLIPGAAEHWTDEALAELGRALAACAARYGWTFGAMLSHPAGALAVAVGALAWPVLKPYALPYLPAALGGGAPAPAPDPGPAAAPAPTPAPAPAAGGISPNA